MARNKRSESAQRRAAAKKGKGTTYAKTGKITPNMRNARRKVNRMLNKETKRNFGTIGLKRMNEGDTG